MNILYLGLPTLKTLSCHGIYSDVLRELSRLGHNIFCVTAVERRNKEKTHLINDNYGKLIVVKTMNIQKTNIFEKGIGTLLIPHQFTRAINKLLNNQKFDLILYPTPPITLYGTIKRIKKQSKATTYLMLKDIFPQNAVDLGLMKKKGLLYRYFRNKEKKLYQVSDKIGCMSPANVEYVLKHNSEVKKEKVEICPNCIEPQDFSLSFEEAKKMRIKYGIPLDKRIFVYGGNLGKPQGIDFLIKSLQRLKENKDVFFLIVGNGTEYGKLHSFLENGNFQNVKLIKMLPKEDYDRMIASCDVGLIFLDYRFSIPNFPSRLLSYLQVGLPILACTDENSDIGQFVEKEGIGVWCPSNDVERFAEAVNNFDFTKEYYYLVRSILYKYFTIDNAVKCIEGAK